MLNEFCLVDLYIPEPNPIQPAYYIDSYIVHRCHTENGTYFNIPEEYEDCIKDFYSIEWFLDCIRRGNEDCVWIDI